MLPCVIVDCEGENRFVPRHVVHTSSRFVEATAE
jgi:hypothetical protein